MEELSYGKGYQYAHDYEEKLTRMQCLPDGLRDRKYYRPAGEGTEREIAERLAEIRAWKGQDRV